jgi:hypothetical protein
MRVDVIRRGGLAGVAVHAALDTAQLATADATRAEAALRNLPWGRSPAVPTRADRFRYEVIAVESGHQRHVELGESEIPDPLRPLLELLPEHGQIRPASG